MSTTVSEVQKNVNYYNGYLLDQTGFRPTDGDDTTVSDEISGNSGATNTDNTTDKPSNKKTEKKGKDEVDDGKISFGKKLKNLAKGVGNFFKGLVCDEDGKFSIGQTLKTVAIGAAIAAASILIPGAGTAIAIAALGISGTHIVKAGIDIANAKTDADDELAWQNMGSGLTEGALAFTGAKATNAFGKMSRSYKTAETAYKAEGFKGITREVKSSASETLEGTKANWKSLTKSEDMYTRTHTQYEEQINKAEAKGNHKKAEALRAESRAYSDGYEAVKTGDYKTVQGKLAELRKEVNEAKADVDRNPGNPDALEYYKNAKTKYQAAEKTVKARANKGEFKAEEPNASDVLKEAKEKTNNAYDEMKKAKKTLDEAKKGADETEIAEAQKAYDKAYNEYADAAAEESALKGGSPEYISVIKSATKEGWKSTETKINWITMSGRGRQEAA